MRNFLSVLLAITLAIPGLIYAAALNVAETGNPSVLTPTNSATRVISLASRGYDCYTTNLGSISRKMIKARSHNATTGEETPVKMSVNSPDGNKYWMEEEVFKINSGTTKICFTNISTTAMAVSVTGE